MYSPEKSPFRVTALQLHVRTTTAPAAPVGLSARRIVVVWALLALCIGAAAAVLVAVWPLVSR